MLSWQNMLDDDVLDHLTSFRLSMPDSHFDDDPEEVWWSVLIEITNISISGFEQAASQYAEDLLIPAAYDPADRARILSRQPVAIFARKALIEVLNVRKNEFGVASVHLGAVIPNLFLDRYATSPADSTIHVADEAVVMAVIDEGIGIAHDLFRRGPTESRIEHATLFDSVPDKHRSQASIGRCYERHEIDEVLRRCQHNGLLDEYQFYAQTGQADFKGDTVSNVARRVSHGTHVMALAAGMQQHEITEDRPIICVGLPSRAVKDTTGLDLLPLLYLSFHILSKQAARFHTKTKGLAPVVCNFSFGNTGGPHDGTGVFATLFNYYFGDESDFVARDQKAWLTLPAGNSNLAQLHAVQESARAQITLDLLVLPDDHTPSSVQCWLPVSDEEDQPNFATICVTPPGQTEAGCIATQPGQRASLKNAAGQEVARLAYQFVGGAVQRGLVTLVLNPTADLDAEPVLAPAGHWRIMVKRNMDAPTGDIHLWVRRDETITGSQSGGRQAYLSADDYVRFGKYGEPLAVDPPNSDCPIKRSGTLSGFAGGNQPIVVAGYVARDAELAGYSSAGPLNERENFAVSERKGPDLAARSDDSLLVRGVLSAGSRSGSWVRLSGTSVAAPQVARAAAKGIGSDHERGRRWSHAAVKENPVVLDASVERAGAGGINIPIWKSTT